MSQPNETLRIRNLPFDDEGKPMEPEEQPAQHIIPMDFGLKSQQSGVRHGTIQGQIVMETTVAEAASVARNPCFTCKHFDREAWLKLFAAWDSPQAPFEYRQQVNNMRAALITSENANISLENAGADGDIDVEHALNSMGVCRAMSEVLNDVIIVYPTAGCPDTYVSPTQPQGFYQPSSTEADRLGSSRYDAILRAAQGVKL